MENRRTFLGTAKMHWRKGENNHALQGGRIASGMIAAALVFLSFAKSPVARGGGDIIGLAPTSTSTTMLRGHEGAFGAPRGPGKTHTGVDIVANQSSMDKNTYRVGSVANGTVAYAKFNGNDPAEGYGYTVIVDHRDGTYALYAHLATIASASLMKVGDSVTAGTTLGYMADLANNEWSSGNVIAKSVPAYDKIQLHFEEFQAPAGRSSTDAIAPIKQNAAILDPTLDLTNHGYK
jgi:murein DD-endopeptidase MepM/ murein hydrolase activator NlpD